MNVFGYHEFVANSHAAITNALNLGQRENAKRIALQLYIFAKSHSKNRKSIDELLEDVKELSKKEFEEIYIRANYALTDAGYSGVQEFAPVSFFKSIMQKKKLE